MSLSALSDVANELAGDRDIGQFLRHYVPQRVRFVKLQINDMFKALLDLYEPYFTSYRFRDVKHFTPPEIYKDNPCRFFAAVYVSAWFHDLYVLNRKACQTLYLCDCYSFHDIYEVSTDYDAFLCSLSSSIRPTKIKTIHEDTLFVPIIIDEVNPNAVGQNYFDIDGWVMDYTLFHCLFNIIQRKRVFKIQSLSETSTGNPSWLFDWHNNVAYAWFPSEGNSNYSMEDAATTAYILGVACTPSLGPCDFDEWQLMPNNDADFELPEPTKKGRVRPMVQSGAATAHVYERRSYHFPPAVKNLIHVQENAASMLQEQGSKRRRIAAANSASNEDNVVTLQPLEQYRIVSYVYHNQVTDAVEGPRRLRALTDQLFDGLTARARTVSCYASSSSYVLPTQTRCMNLQRNHLFKALVDLYASIFTIHSHHFNTFLESFSPPPPQNNNYADNPCRFAAAVYVSTWFHDLYVVNRIVTSPTHDLACRKHYSLLGNINLVSETYDVFLSMLIGAIRPTKINTTPRPILFIPIIHDIVNPTAAGRNYFNIDGWVMNDVVFRGLLRIIQNNKIFETQSLSLTPVLGRPSWLFDWHENDAAYAWFPSEGNYSIEDAAMAYILGVACTPRLGPCDYDEWQLMPNNDRHYQSLPTPTEGRRVRPMVLFGETTVHIYEHRSYHFPDEVKNAIQLQVCEDSVVNFQPLEEYRIVSYVYHDCVVNRVNAKSRSLLFRHIIRSRIYH